MANLIQVTDDEWTAAQAFFDEEDKKEKKSNIKFKDKKKANHSFIRVNGEIFVMETKGFVGHLLGEGSFGKVRMVQTRNGENFAVKIEARNPRGEHDSETKIMKTLNYIKGEELRSLTSKKLFKGKKTSKKLYTVTQLRKGDELYKEIYFEKKRKSLKTEEKLNISLNACKAVEILHNHNIVHADLKPANFMANREGEEILIESIDYGFSLILTPPATKIHLNSINGSPRYMAPEIQFGIYSYASDIYALGKMLSYDLELDRQDNTVISELVEKMQDFNPDKRPKLDEIIKQLTLAHIIEKNQNTLNLIKNFFEQIDPLEENHYAYIIYRLVKEQKNIDFSIISYLIPEKISLKQAIENNIDANILLSIIDQNDNFNELEKDNTTLFMSAIINKYPDSILMKLINNTNLNLQNKDGNTALILAIKYNASNHVIKAIIEQGANLNIKNKEGNAAIIFSEKNGNQEITDILRLATLIPNFSKKWTEEALEKTYLTEKRNIISKINPILYFFQNSKKISNIRNEQLSRLFGSIAAFNSSNSSNKKELLLHVFQTIGFIQAQSGRQAGSRLNKLLQKIEVDLNQLCIHLHVSIEEIKDIKEVGAQQYHNKISQEKKSKKKR